MKGNWRKEKSCGEGKGVARRAPTKVKDRQLERLKILTVKRAPMKRREGEGLLVVEKRVGKEDVKPCKMGEGNRGIRRLGTTIFRRGVLGK